MTPDLRARLRTELIGHEGLVTRAYDDATGRVIQPGTTVRGWVTVGYGRNLVGKGLTVRESDYLLSNDIADVERELDARIAWWRSLDDARMLAIAEMAFQLGAANLTAKWPNFLRAVQTGDYRRAAAIIRASLLARQVPSRAEGYARLIEAGRFT